MRIGCRPLANRVASGFSVDPELEFWPTKGFPSGLDAGSLVPGYVLFHVCLSKCAPENHLLGYKSLTTQSHRPLFPSMTGYLECPRFHEIAAQLYADQLSEDQRFRLQNELDDAAVLNILGDPFLRHADQLPAHPSTIALLGQYPDVTKKPQGQARRSYNIQAAAGIGSAVYKVMKVHSVIWIWTHHGLY